jgi:nucleoside-diphosphate-sugar epimerase
VRVVVTGAAGFIGRSIVRQLAARGDHVVALVRDPATATHVAAPTVELATSDLTDVAALTELARGADGLIHAAGSYRVGIAVSERPAMLDANLGTTERVLDAAIAARVPRIVCLSTINAYGNTHGRIVDETYRRDPNEGYGSYYDETKWLAQLAAEERIAAGAPVMIVQPGVTYGPGDHSSVGQQLLQAYLGTAAFIALGSLGISPVHVDDLAAGIIAALDRGSPGRTYVLGGPNVRLKEAMGIAARAAGHGPPRLNVPTWFLRIGARLGPNLGGMFGLSPNLREIMKSSDGVTFWASSARAAAELGYRPRDLAAGFADAFGGGTR